MPDYYYYEDLDALVTMLSERPKGKMKVLIGSDTSIGIETDLMLRIQAYRQSLGHWLISKMQKGDFKLAVGTKAPFPEGLLKPCAFCGERLATGITSADDSVCEQCKQEFEDALDDESEKSE